MEKTTGSMPHKRTICFDVDPSNPVAANHVTQSSPVSNSVVVPQHPVEQLFSGLSPDGWVTDEETPSPSTNMTLEVVAPVDVLVVPETQPLQEEGNLYFLLMRMTTCVRHQRHKAREAQILMAKASNKVENNGNFTI